MKTLFFSTHEFERNYLNYWIKKLQLDAELLDSHLNYETVSLVKEAQCVSCWASDILDKPVLERLSEQGVKFIALRSAGFSHLDLDTAKDLGFSVARVPAYSPQAIAKSIL